MSENRMEIMWGVRLLDDGFTQIPNLIIRNYRKLGVQHGEWSLICQLLSYKHDERDPYPSRETLGAHLCVSEKQIQKWTVSLKEKGLLRTGRRRNVHNKQWDNLVYNFKPLLDAVLQLVGETPLPTPATDFEIVWDDEPQEPQVPVGLEPQVPVGLEPQVPLKKKKKEDHKYMIDCSAEVSASSESIFESNEIVQTLQEHAGFMMIDNHRSMQAEPQYIAQIYVMLLKQFQNQLDAAIVANACELYKDRSYNWVKGCMKLDLENPVAFFNSCYKDAVKAYKASQQKGARR